MSALLKQLAAIGTSPRKNQFWGSGAFVFRRSNRQKKILIALVFVCLFALASVLIFLKKQLVNDMPRTIATTSEVTQISPMQVAILHLSEKRYEEALKEFQVLVQASPDDATALSNLGFAYSLIGNFNEARLAYQKAIHKSEDPVIVQNLAVLEIKAGRANVAVLILTNLENKNLCKGNCLFHFALAHEKQGNISEAVNKFQSYAKEVNDPEIKNKTMERIQKLNSLLASEHNSGGNF